MKFTAVFAVLAHRGGGGGGRELEGVKPPQDSQGDFGVGGGAKTPPTRFNWPGSAFLILTRTIGTFCQHWVASVGGHPGRGFSNIKMSIKRFPQQYQCLVLQYHRIILNNLLWN